MKGKFLKLLLNRSINNFSVVGKKSKFLLKIEAKAKAKIYFFMTKIFLTHIQIYQYIPYLLINIFIGSVNFHSRILFFYNEFFIVYVLYYYYDLYIIFHILLYVLF